MLLWATSAAFAGARIDIGADDVLATVALSPMPAIENAAPDMCIVALGWKDRVLTTQLVDCSSELAPAVVAASRTWALTRLQATGERGGELVHVAFLSGSVAHGVRGLVWTDSGEVTSIDHSPDLVVARPEARRNTMLPVTSMHPPDDNAGTGASTVLLGYSRGIDSPLVLYPRAAYAHCEVTLDVDLLGDAHARAVAGCPDEYRAEAAREAELDNAWWPKLVDGHPVVWSTTVGVQYATNEPHRSEELHQRRGVQERVGIELPQTMPPD
jgi:hypothetical protein